MCGGNNDAQKAQSESHRLAQQQFQWQKNQAHQAEQDAMERRQSMEHGLTKIGRKFSQFDSKYYGGIADQFRDYANPQVEKSQAACSIPSH